MIKGYDLMYIGRIPIRVSCSDGHEVSACWFDNQNQMWRCGRDRREGGRCEFTATDLTLEYACPAGHWPNASSSIAVVLQSMGDYGLHFTNKGGGEISTEYPRLREFEATG